MESTEQKPGKIKRSRKITDAKLQLKLTFWFVGATALALIFQFLVFASAMSELGANLPNDSGIFFESYLQELLWSMAGCAGIALSLSFLTGILLTFRVTGPIYRMEQYLREVKSGAKPADCRLRQSDELKGLCSLINEATAPLRQADDSQDEQVIRDAA